MTTAPIPALDRVPVDAALVDLVACLRAAGLHAVAAAVEAPTTDAARAAAIHEESDRIPVGEDRAIYLRTAAPWVARALEALVKGDARGVRVWGDYAAIELERYRGTPRGDSE